GRPGRKGYIGDPGPEGLKGEVGDQGNVGKLGPPVLDSSHATLIFTERFEVKSLRLLGFIPVGLLRMKVYQIKETSGETGTL
ncbi:uncharacterized, partial [Tachysurus ichikawai]